MEDIIPDEPVIITISEDDYIKRMPIDTFREQRRGGHGVIGHGHEKRGRCAQRHLRRLYP